MLTADFYVSTSDELAQLEIVVPVTSKWWCVSKHYFISLNLSYIVVNAVLSMALNWLHRVISPVHPGANDIGGWSAIKQHQSLLILYKTSANYFLCRLLSHSLSASIAWILRKRSPARSWRHVVEWVASLLLDRLRPAHRPQMEPDQDGHVTAGQTPPPKTTIQSKSSRLTKSQLPTRLVKFYPRTFYLKSILQPASHCDDSDDLNAVVLDRDWAQKSQFVAFVFLFIKPRFERLLLLLSGSLHWKEFYAVTI